jgi:hypothetical protein
MPNEYNISFCPLCLPLTPRSAIFQGIDQDPKRAYKAVISTASEPLCATLRPASAAETAVLDETFRAACASDLRASLARVRLYVPDACTAVVLVQHAVNRIGDAYGALRLAARQVGARVAAGENGLMDDEVLKRLLKDVCGEEVLDGAGSPPGRVSVYPSLTEHKYRLHVFRIASLRDHVCSLTGFVQRSSWHRNGQSCMRHITAIKLNSYKYKLRI